MKYAYAYDIATVTIECRQARGYLFPPGAAREIALAAVPFDLTEDMIDAMRDKVAELEMQPFDDPHDEADFNG